MPKELIEEKFNAILWRFNSIELLTPEMELKLRIAFQEGVIVAQTYVAEKIGQKLSEIPPNPPQV